MPFSLNVILQLHSWLYRYLPSPGGQWKTTDNEITEIHSDGKKRIRFIPSNAFETPLAMENLIKVIKCAFISGILNPLLLFPLQF